uniref:Integrase catalytic domain-containing protein n=1 Tax=Fagus sylvatica TaxID=28930 RepID=A0A2N9HCN5_FAGSY
MEVSNGKVQKEELSNHEIELLETSDEEDILELEPPTVEFNSIDIEPKETFPEVTPSKLDSLQAVLVLPGVIPLPQLSPALPSRHRQKSGCLRCQEADSSPNGLAATLGSRATGTPITTHPLPLERSRKARLNHTKNSPIGCRMRHHTPPKDSAAVKLFATRPRACLSCPSQPLAPRHPATSALDHRSAALTASESVPSSDAASFDPVSLTTPTYSIADLQALFSQVQVLSSSASNPALFVTPGISSEWFLDSACCNHMTDNPHLTSAHTPPILPIITTADGSAMTVSHVGSIFTPNLSVSNVFCVPKLHLNLLSVGQLTEFGLNLFFSSRGCLVQDSRTGQIVGTARKVGRLFELTSLHLPSSSVSAPVQSLPVHLIVCHVSSVNNLPYLFIITQYSKAIKVFRSDNAREYRQTDFSTILKHYGTIFHTSCAGTSQQNGRAERKLHHILDTIRALTNAASTPASFWGEATLTAMYTINRCPSPIVQNITPYERLFGTTPNYILLKVFCCICFVFLQPHEHTKLQPRSQLCCFLGYRLEERGTGVLIQSPSVFESLGMWYSGNTKCSISLPLFSAGNSDSQADPLPNFFPEILSTSAESVNPISDESPPADPSSNKSPTANPTFDESPLSAPAANPVNTTAPEPHRSHRVLRDLVDLPAGKFAIGYKWVYKIKTRSDGTVDRYKACLVAKGFTQEYGIDYEETFAPVARLSSVRTLITVSASRHWPLFQMDVKNTFLNGELTEEVYMQLPPGFSQPPGFSPKVCRLRRALYGLKQAPRAWASRILSAFLGQHFEMKDLGPLSYFLGLEVSSSSDGYYLTQAKYTSDLISLAGITDSKIVDTPIEYNNCLNTHDGEPLPDATLYRYQFMAAPRSLHYAAVLRILRYLKGTLFHGLHFSSQSSLTLQAYSDADWFRSIVTIEVPSKLPTMTSSMSVPSILRLTVTLFVITYYRVLCNSCSVSSQDQLADIFTKPMPPGRFRDLISKLKLVSLHPT